MTSKQKKLLIGLLLILAAVGIAGLTLALALGFFFAQGRTPDGIGQPHFTTQQSPSIHAGYFHTILTAGTNVYVSDYEEASLQMTVSEPKPVIGRRDFGNALVGAIPGQPTSAYVATDVGSEMPAYAVYRQIGHPPFDSRNATFREMSYFGPSGSGVYLQTTNPVLLAEVIRLLREGTPVALPPFTFVGLTNIASLKMSCDALPGLLFCPSVYNDSNGVYYLAESMMTDTATAPPKLTARWIPVTPTLAQWLGGR